MYSKPNFTFIQKLSVGQLVLLRNSARDGRKGDKLAKRWLGPYTIEEEVGKGLYMLTNPSTGKTLKKAVNGCKWVCKLCTMNCIRLCSIRI